MPGLSALPVGLSDYGSQWDDFGAVVSRIYDGLRARPADTQWAIVGRLSGRTLGTVTAADFLFKLERMSWSLTDESYDNGGVGQVVSHYEHGQWVAASEEINTADFAVYMSWPSDIGAAYLCLHETAHVTTLGLQTNTLCYDQFIDQGGDPRYYANSHYWIYNEAIANQIAATIANDLGYGILPNPGGGYPLRINRRLAIA